MYYFKTLSILHLLFLICNLQVEKLLSMTAKAAMGRESIVRVSMLLPCFKVIISAQHAVSERGHGQLAGPGLLEHADDAHPGAARGQGAATRRGGRGRQADAATWPEAVQVIYFSQHEHANLFYHTHYNN